MSYTLSWYIPQRVILVHLSGELTLIDVENMINEGMQMVGEGVAPVHILLDDAKGGNPPFTSVTQAISLLKLARHPFLGWVIGYGDVHPVANYMVEIAARVLRIKFKRVKSSARAVAFLTLQDESLITDKVG